MPRYYTLGVVTSETKLQSDAELVRRYLRAWQKSLDWMVTNPDAAATGVLSRFPEINEAEARANLTELIRITTSPDTDAHGIGWQDPAVWKAQETFLRDQRLINADVDVSKAMTNDYLPSK